MSEQKAMKAGLSVDAVTRISNVLLAIDNKFPARQFADDALKGLELLELKQRVEHLIGVLADYLPDDFEQAADILLQIKQHWDWGDEQDALSGFAAWPLTDYVAVYGLEQPEISLAVLKKLTGLFSAEFAIRPFIEQHFDLTYETLLLWCSDPDEHVRRLASEGIRPRLPWGKRLVEFCGDPAAIFPILERLKDDTSAYVRKSVANNLNDITKDNPDKVIDLCQQWRQDATTERRWIIRHGLRSLVKSGHPEVFSLLGYSRNTQVKVMDFRVAENAIQLGQNISVALSLLSQSSQAQKLVVDYKIHHVKANGSLTSKVFKWKNITLLPQQQLTLQKTHSFKPITMRKYYAGTHLIELLINGQSYAKAEFELVL